MSLLHLSRKDVGVLSYFTYFNANNSFITSRLIILYISDLNFITVVRLFNVCYRSEMKMAQTAEISLLNVRAVMKYVSFPKRELRQNK
jgi:hypothetical protein